MPGEAVVLAGYRGGRIPIFVTALARFPTEPQWAVIGGFAVNVRITHIHRLTNDIDSEPTVLVGVEAGDIVAKASAPIATASSLIALKAVEYEIRHATTVPHQAS